MIVRTLWKHSEDNRNIYLALLNKVKTINLVSNSKCTLINQDPVLNEAAARLGQSLRETEDQLIRDMLEATASIVNCTGGTNGGIAVLKSDLIDLELSAHNGGDNKAQVNMELAA